MDESLRQLLADLLAAGRVHDEGEAVHTRRLVNLEADTAQLMAILVQSTRRARVLEIGTSNGYSALWLAWALRPLDGRLISIERDAAKLYRPRRLVTWAGRCWKRGRRPRGVWHNLTAPSPASCGRGPDRRSAPSGGPRRRGCGATRGRLGQLEECRPTSLPMLSFRRRCRPVAGPSASPRAASPYRPARASSAAPTACRRGRGDGAPG